MGIINTQTFGLMKPGARVTARNSHLMPEIHQRAQRILHSAKEEAIMALNVVREMGELWSKYKNGEVCTCVTQQQKLNESEEMSKGNIDILDFLKSGNVGVLANREFCPICYGTGIVGGYDLLGTHSITLHAGTPGLKLKKLSVEQKTPYRIRCGTSGTATWEVQLPKYFIQCHTIVAHWTPRPPQGFELLLNDKPFNIDVFNLLGQTNREKVKLTIRMEDSSGEISLDYLRIILKMNRDTLVSVDIPNYTYNYTGALAVQQEVQSSITMNFAGTVDIDTSDIIVLEKDGIMWRIIENEFNAPMGVTISSNCQARLVRAFEFYYLLPSKCAHTKYPMKNYTFFY
jgi:hypothetical protein